MRYITIQPSVLLTNIETGEQSEEEVSFLATCVRVPLSNQEVFGASMETLFHHAALRGRFKAAQSVHDEGNPAELPAHVELTDEEYELLEQALRERKAVNHVNVESQVVSHYRAILDAARDKPTEGTLITSDGASVALGAGEGS